MKSSAGNRPAEPEKAAPGRSRLGGICGIVPIVVFYRNQPALARTAALEHLALTHPGVPMRTAATLVVDLLLAVLAGTPLREAIVSQIVAQKNPLVGHPFMKWLSEADEMVVVRRLSTACYVEFAVPAVVYMALKYHDDPEAALIANTNLGGDNAGRGAILGALIGAEHGFGGFPRRWVENLVDPPPDL